MFTVFGLLEITYQATDLHLSSPLLWNYETQWLRIPGSSSRSKDIVYVDSLLFCSSHTFETS